MPGMEVQTTWTSRRVPDQGDLPSARLDGILGEDGHHRVAHDGFVVDHQTVPGSPQARSASLALTGNGASTRAGSTATRPMPAHDT
jgi:hypothetical protein